MILPLLLSLLRPALRQAWVRDQDLAPKIAAAMRGSHKAGFWMLWPADWEADFDGPDYIGYAELRPSLRKQAHNRPVDLSLFQSAFFIISGEQLCSDFPERLRAATTTSSTTTTTPTTKTDGGSGSGDDKGDVQASEEFLSYTYP